MDIETQRDEDFKVKKLVSDLAYTQIQVLNGIIIITSSSPSMTMIIVMG